MIVEVISKTIVPKIPIPDQSQSFSGRVEIEFESESIAGLAYQVKAQIPLDNAAGLHQAKLVASGFQLDKTQPIDEGGLENSLIVKILKGEGKSLEILYDTGVLG